jgi:hypothetical protein
MGPYSRPPTSLLTPTTTPALCGQRQCAPSRADVCDRRPTARTEARIPRSRFSCRRRSPVQHGHGPRAATRVASTVVSESVSTEPHETSGSGTSSGSGLGSRFSWRIVRCHPVPSTSCMSQLLAWKGQKQPLWGPSPRRAVVRITTAQSAPQPGVTWVSIGLGGRGRTTMDRNALAAHDLAGVRC